MQFSSSSVVRTVTSRQKRIKWGQIATIIGFLLPTTILYIVLVLLPVLQAVYYSFFRWNGLGPLQNFVGLANYTRAFNDKVFIGALSHNLQLVVLSIVLQLPLALGLALLVGRKLPGRAMFRTVFFLPFVHIPHSELSQAAI